MDKLLKKYTFQGKQYNKNFTTSYVIEEENTFFKKFNRKVLLQKQCSVSTKESGSARFIWARFSSYAEKRSRCEKTWRLPDVVKHRSISPTHLFSPQNRQSR